MTDKKQVTCEISKELHDEMEKYKNLKELKTKELIPLLIQKWVIEQKLK